MMMIKISELDAALAGINIMFLLSMLQFVLMDSINRVAYILMIEGQRFEFLSGVYVQDTIAASIVMGSISFVMFVDLWWCYLKYQERRKAYL
jgi:hypothetical protein